MHTAGSEPRLGSITYEAILIRIDLHALNLALKNKCPFLMQTNDFPGSASNVHIIIHFKAIRQKHN